MRFPALFRWSGREVKGAERDARRWAQWPRVPRPTKYADADTRTSECHPARVGPVLPDLRLMTATDRVGPSAR
jgi:hypothetical protein